MDKEVKHTQKIFINQKASGLHSDNNLSNMIKIENINIYMFFLNQEIYPFYLKTKVSYKFDQEIQTEKLDLWKYNNVFFPDN